MANANLNVQVQKMELTTQRVTWKGIDLGGTNEGVKIEIKYMKGDIKADQYGETVMDKRLNGLSVKVTTALAQVRDPAFWAKIFPSAVLAGSVGDQSLTFGQDTGRSALSDAGALVLHPVVLADADLTQDHTFYLACPNEESSLNYGPKDQVKATLVFDIFPQILTGNGGALKFYKFGDPAV
jgi:hypothetical protein